MAYHTNGNDIHNDKISFLGVIRFWIQIELIARIAGLRNAKKNSAAG